jgi:hypothetical protein
MTIFNAALIDVKLVQKNMMNVNIVKKIIKELYTRKINVFVKMDSLIYLIMNLVCLAMQNVLAVLLTRTNVQVAIKI